MKMSENAKKFFLLYDFYFIFIVIVINSKKLFTHNISGVAIYIISRSSLFSINIYMLSCYTQQEMRISNIYTDMNIRIPTLPVISLHFLFDSGKGSGLAFIPVERMMMVAGKGEIFRCCNLFSVSAYNQIKYYDSISLLFITNTIPSFDHLGGCICFYIIRGCVLC